MQNPAALANRVLTACLADDPWSPADLHALIAQAASPDEDQAKPATAAFFGILVERLGDLFEPRLVQKYVEIFAETCSRILSLDAHSLISRYARIRQPKPFHGSEPKSVYVLSRVTLGADVAVTSVLIDAACKRFPAAEICFVGPHKNYELFAANSRISHLPLNYGRRGLLRDRLESWHGLRDALNTPDSIVLDPDSRLTQLGILPVAIDDRYYFFESRGYGGASHDALPQLAARWCRETLEVRNARAFLSPYPPKESDPPGTVTISLGVGENQDKRIAGSFEQDLVRMLLDDGVPLVMDYGAGGEESDRVERIVASAPKPVRTWQGSFAPFAWRIAHSALYVGYDSSGHHVAAAAGVPLLSIFRGFASERAFWRWRPCGQGPIEIVRITGNPDPQQVLSTVRVALENLRDSRLARTA